MHRLPGIIALAAMMWTCAPASVPAIDTAQATSGFLSTAAQGGLAAVEAARLAVSVTKNPAVKEYAYGIIYDHEHMNEQLARIAAKRGITLPAGPDGERASVLRTLREASPAAFDAMYLAHAAEEHEQTVQLLQSNLLHADTEVAVFASYNLPREKAHGRLASDLKASLSLMK
jgi:putative membrane protein